MTIPTPEIAHGFMSTEKGYLQQQIDGGETRPSLWWAFTLDADIGEILVDAKGATGDRRHAEIPSVRPKLIIITLRSDGSPEDTKERTLGAVTVAGFNAGHDIGITGTWKSGDRVLVGVRGTGGDDAIPGCYLVTGLRFEAAR